MTYESGAPEPQGVQTHIPALSWRQQSPDGQTPRHIGGPAFTPHGTVSARQVQVVRPVGSHAVEAIP